MDLVCTENAHNKSLVYSGTEALSELPTGWSKLQGQEMYSFEGAYVEFSSPWDLNSVSETAKELLNTCQTNAKYEMPNTICQIADTKTNTTYQVLYAKQQILKQMPNTGGKAGDLNSDHLYRSNA